MVGAATIAAKVKIVCVVCRVVCRDESVKLSGEGKVQCLLLFESGQRACQASVCWLG
jgi:hypothetical protein